MQDDRADRENEEKGGVLLLVPVNLIRISSSFFLETLPFLSTLPLWPL